MTLQRLLLFLVLTVNVCTSGLSAQDAATLLSLAVYEEEVNGDLTAAVKLYKQVTSDFPGDRASVAEALLRLGIAHEKIGNQAARAYYEQVISEFRDQIDQVRQARERLRRLIGESTNSEPTAPERDAEMMRINTVYSPGISPRSVSPDGKYFSFADPARGNLSIYDRLTDSIVKLTPDSAFVSKTGMEPGMGGASTRSVWSPDGNRIAYRWVKREGGAELRVFDLKTNAFFVLCPSLSRSGPFPLDWTSDGSRILCDLLDRQKGERALVLITLNTCTVDTITVLKGDKPSRSTPWASLSRNDSLLLYQRQDESGAYNIHLASIDGSADRMIQGWPMSNERYPAWLNDQSGFLFMSNFTGMNGLWKATIDAQLNVLGTKLLVEGVGAIHGPLGMTRHDTYYYMSRVSISNLYRTTVDFESLEMGDDQLIVSQNKEGRSNPVLSPDGQTLAYYRSLHQVEIRDMATGIETTVLVNLPESLSFRFAPFRWTPSGTHLLIAVLNRGVQSQGGSVFATILVNVASGEHDVVVEHGDFPALDQEETTLYFHRDRMIFAKDLQSGREEAIFRSEGHVYFMAVSPDGQHLAFYQGPSDKVFFYNQLVLMSLQDYTTTVLWETPADQRFLERINWLPNGKQLMLTTTKLGKLEAQAYLCDIQTGEMH
ncbi:MAG: tetratricopeptide repeat protein, partial [Saprospiraceae bacterium]|nr:tetratricopeptide repeat protein [Saprospiraceae bacterium]